MQPLGGRLLFTESPVLKSEGIFGTFLGIYVGFGWDRGCSWTFWVLQASRGLIITIKGVGEMFVFTLTGELLILIGPFIFPMLMSHICCPRLQIIKLCFSSWNGHARVLIRINLFVMRSCGSEKPICKL
jgi:hypothetical protein